MLCGFLIWEKGIGSISFLFASTQIPAAALASSYIAFWFPKFVFFAFPLGSADFWHLELQNVVTSYLIGGGEKF